MKNLFLIFLLFLMSCSRTSVSEKEAESLKNEIKIKQNPDAFFWLQNYYENSNQPEEIIPYSLVMTKDSSKIGCYDFYKQYLKILHLGKFDRKNLYKLDKEERTFLLYILKKGALKGDEYCQDELFYFYNDELGIERNKIKADSLYKLLPTSQTLKHH